MVAKSVGVPAETVAHGERTLEVHARAGAKRAERRARGRLVGEVGEDGAVILRQHGQADPVDGEALPALERRAVADAQTHAREEI